MQIYNRTIRLNTGNPLGRDLILALPMQEGGGYTCFDYSKTGKNAVFHATNTPVWGVFRGGKLPTGNADGQLSIGNLGTGFPSEGSISFWMYATTLSNWPNVLDFDESNYFRIELNSSGALKILLDYVDSSDIHDISTNIVAYTWYHIVATWSTTDNNVKTYVNAVKTLDETQDNWTNIDFSNVWLLTGFGASRNWKGGLQNLLVYEKRLTDQEVSRLYINPWQVYTIGKTEIGGIASAASSRTLYIVT